MKKRSLRSLGISMLALGLVSLSTLTSALAADTSPARPSALQAAMLSNLDFLKNVFQAQYAPVNWKKSFAQWDLDRQIDEAKASASRAMTLKDYQKALTHFFDSTRDYHTSIRFVATEQANLPFMVKGAEGRYFIVYIDRAKLPLASFPFNEGDELVRFGGKSADEAVKELLAGGVTNTAQTDQEEAEQALTNRRAARGFTVPRGPVMIAVRAKGADKVLTQQLLWNYTEEKIPNLMQRFGSTNMVNSTEHFFNKMMIGGNANIARGASLEANPYTIGGRKTFTPALGKKIWESDDSEPFHAYIYQNAERKLIGYVRIPSYVPAMYTKDTATALAHFRKVITLFESTTDGMVIDQVNNPGGSVFYLYTLASMLSDQALSTPRHRMSITQADVMRANTLLDKLNTVQNDDDAKKLLSGDADMSGELDGYPMTYESAMFFKGFCQFLIQEFAAGHTLTNAYWLSGADHINPAPEHYTKPILLLTNALDFSGGDFFPAIMQDNKRVTILGTRTAGAGGYVLDFSYPNQFGIDVFRVTGSIAERADKNPIENLGVKPEIEYSITADDLQNGFPGYVKAIQSTISSMLK